MQKDLNEQLTELRSTLGKMEVALGSISDAIVWTDQKGQIQWRNSPFDNLIGNPHIANLGRPLVELLPLMEHGTPLPPEAHPANLILERKTEINGYFDFARFWGLSGASGAEGREVQHHQQCDDGCSDFCSVFCEGGFYHLKSPDTIHAKP